MYASNHSYSLVVAKSLILCILYQRPLMWVPTRPPEYKQRCILLRTAQQVLHCTLHTATRSSKRFNISLKFEESHVVELA